MDCREVHPRPFASFAFSNCSNSTRDAEPASLHGTDPRFIRGIRAQFNSNPASARYEPNSRLLPSPRMTTGHGSNDFIAKREHPNMESPLGLSAECRLKMEVARDASRRRRVPRALSDR